ncbi:MAG TPA: hypothetical protein VNH83_22715 [Bryobacteraceae bacterium]|nr:hypothetical protein [Bryobacteraceae bacterium]
MEKKTLRLPIPPSVNQAYGNNSAGKGKGRYKTGTYKTWERAADNEMLIQRIRGPITTGPATIVIRLPQYMRGDVDNRIKPCLDWLVSRELTADDSTHQAVTARRDPTLGRVSYCEVDITWE